MRLPKFRRGSWRVTLPIATIAVVYMLCVFLPRQRYADELREELRSKQQFLTQAASLRPVVEQTRQQIDEADAYVQTWRGRAGRSGELADLFGRLNQLAQQAGAEVDRFDPLESTAMETLSRTSVEWEVAGTLRQLLEVTAGVDALPQLLWIDQLHLRSPEQPGGPMTCAARLVVFDDNSQLSD